MKQSYTDSLISLAAAATRASSFHINKYDNTVADLVSKGSTTQGFNIKNHNSFTTVGIKFDNNSARKYFVLIYDMQRHPVVNKTTEKDDDPVFTAPVTGKMN